MINNLTLVGRLTVDPELRKTEKGVSVVNFTLACKKRTQTRRTDRCRLYKCVTWGKNADNLVNYTKKGTMIGIVGYIQTRNYEDKDGKKIYVTEAVAETIQYLSSPKEHSESKTMNYEEETEILNSDVLSDNLPF